MEYFVGFDHATDLKNQLAYAYKRGYKRGYREGCREVREEIAVNILKMNYSVESIAKMVNLPINVVEKIKAKLELH